MSRSMFGLGSSSASTTAVVPIKVNAGQTIGSKENASVIDSNPNVNKEKKGNNGRSKYNSQGKRKSLVRPTTAPAPRSTSNKIISSNTAPSQNESCQPLATNKVGASAHTQSNTPNTSSTIRVFVRVRPLSSSELSKSHSHFSVVDVMDNNKEVTLNEFCAMSNDYLRQKRMKTRRYRFDTVFDPKCSQEEVFDLTTKPLVDAVLEGRNACCFCYGATGAGKTYTMLGTEENPGVMVLALQRLFRGEHKDNDENENIRHEVMLSYLEIYNETVRDLLDASNDVSSENNAIGCEVDNTNAFGNLNGNSTTSKQQSTLQMREDPVAGVVVQGLRQVPACSASEVMTLLHAGNMRRTTESTRSNETSSRSHAVMQASIHKIDIKTNTILSRGKLSLIDLAGSERTLASESKHAARCVEGANINKSLLSLSGCINALVAGKKHIPYRNSKLTLLLKDSLGGGGRGGCMTTMIANLSPSAAVFSETSNTLHWADRAKQIRVSSALPMRQSTSNGVAGGKFVYNSIPSTGGPIESNGAYAGKDVHEIITSLEAQNKILTDKIKELELKSENGRINPTKIVRQRPTTAVPNLNSVETTRAFLDGNYPNGRKLYNTRQHARRQSIATTVSNGCSAPNSDSTSIISDLKNEIARLNSHIAADSQSHSKEVQSIRRECEMKIKHKDDFIRNLILSANEARKTEDDDSDVENEDVSSPPLTRSASKRLQTSDAKPAAKRNALSGNSCDNNNTSLQDLKVRLSTLSKRNKSLKLNVKCHSNSKKRPFCDVSNNVEL